MPSSIHVERKRNCTEISAQDTQEIIGVWSPELASRNMAQRFGLGASLWLIKFEDKLAGYGWTLQGRTVEPHYLHLGDEDVHCFDFHVLSAYRGRGMNPLLVNFILGQLANDCAGRAFIEAAEWNQAQLASLRKTAFRYLGRARKVTVLGNTIVSWSREQDVSESERNRDSLASASGNKSSGIAGLKP